VLELQQLMSAKRRRGVGPSLIVAALDFIHIGSERFANLPWRS